MQRRRHLLLLLWTSLAVLAFGCSGGGADEPELALREFYDLLNGGDHTKALAFYDAEAKVFLSDPDNVGDDGFADWAKAETKQGTIDRIDVVSTQTGEDDARTLEYDVVYRDGSKKRHRVTIRLEGGSWKLGLLG